MSENDLKILVFLEMPLTIHQILFKGRDWVLNMDNRGFRRKKGRSNSIPKTFILEHNMYESLIKNILNEKNI